MKSKYNRILTLVIVFLMQITLSQEKKVSGTVSDDVGPLPGVSIVIKGTNIGTQTDFDGKYAIKVKEGAILSFSFMGYKTIEKKIGEATTINVLMKEGINTLGEVIVTAMGVKKEKKSIGFAQQSIKGEDLNITREVDLNNSIAGKIAGVQILGNPSSGFNSSSIRLRGADNLLYVVDGIKIFEPGVINPDDIEDISILKGSSASALYGPIGRNGVIVITTKRGKRGKAIVSLNHSTSITNAYVLPNYQDEYGGGVSQEFDILNGEKIPKYMATESWGPRLDGTLVRHWDSWIPGSEEFGELRPWSANPNNVRDFFETGLTNDTSLLFSKAGDGYSAKINLRNTITNGIIPNSSVKNHQIGTNLTFNINNKLQVYTNINYSQKKIINNLGGYNSNLAPSFNQSWQRQLDMNRLRKNDYQNGIWYSWNITSPTNLNRMFSHSPFIETEAFRKEYSGDYMYGNIGLNYKATKDITLTTEVRRTTSAHFSNYKTSFTYVQRPDYGETMLFYEIFEVFTSATYKKHLFNSIDLSLMVGSEIYKSKYRSIDASSVNGLTIPGTNSIATSKDRPNYTAQNISLANNGMFSSVNLSYHNFLFLEGSLRADWNSSPDPKNNRVITFGGSGSFLFSELLSSNLLSLGKLRVGYAQAPSFPSSVDVRMQPLEVGTSYNGKTPLYFSSTLENPNIKGGTTNEVEIGTELKFFNNRAGIDFTYFNRILEKNPITIPLSPASGYSHAVTNSGKFTYSGVELALNAKPIHRSDFEWEVGVNFATLKGMTNKLYVDPITGESNDINIIESGTGDITIQDRVGKEAGAIYGRKITRDNKGNMLLNNRGEIVFKQNQYLGNLLPDFTGGVWNVIKYKNFRLSANIDFQSGGKFFSTSQMRGHTSGLLKPTVGNNPLGNPVRDPVIGTAGTAKVVNSKDVQQNSGGVLVSGVDATSGAPTSYYVEARTYWQRMMNLHERWLYDATYVKLRQLSLKYTLPRKVLENTFIESISLSAYANNLWLIYSSVDGIDPSEIENNSASGLRWLEKGQFPSSRSFGLNLNINF